MSRDPADTPSDAVPMTREELEETVASAICCHTQMSPAVQWEIDLLMGAIDKHLAHVLDERDQYASAIRQLILQVKQTAHIWATTLPETIPTADVTKALMGLCSPLPIPDDLRDDLWQRIVGAYYVRFENDGHPEDSKAAGDEAMAVVHPELERLRAAEAGANETARKFLEQRQEMAAERYEWQERALRAEAELARLRGAA